MSDLTNASRNNLSATVYIAAVAVAGAAVLGLSIHNAAMNESGSRVLAWAGLALLTMMAGEFSVGLPMRPCRVSLSDALVFLSVLLFGPALATVTGALDGYAASSRQRGTWQKRLFNTAAMAVSVHLAARLFMLAARRGGVWGDSGLAVHRLVFPLLVLATAQYVLNTALVGGIVTLKEGVPFTAVWRGSICWSGTGYLAGSIVAALAFLVVRQAGVFSFVVILPFPAIFYIAYQAALGRPGRRKIPQEG